MRARGSLFTLTGWDLVWLALSMTVILIILFADPVAAQQSAGRISALTGQATVSHAGRQTAAAPGTPLRGGDRIVTGNGTRVQIAFASGDSAVIGESSEVVLRHFKAAPDGGRDGWLELLEGILRVVLRPGPDTSVEVSTRTAIASVRSTEWVVEALPMTTGVLAISGTVTVTSRATISQVVLNPGEGTDVAATGDPSDAKRWGAARIESALARTRQP